MTGETLDLARLEAEGIYDPRALDAEDRRLLLTRIIELGGTLDEIREAYERHRLPSLMVQLLLTEGEERLTFRQVARRAGVRAHFARAVWRAFGFADPAEHDRRFSPRDAQILAHFADYQALLGEEQTMHTARAIGMAMERIAEAEVAALRTSVEEPLRSHGATSADIHAMLDEVVTDRVAAIERSFVALHRHHLVSLARRYEEWDVPVTTHNVIDLVVGFADLAGSTELAERLDLVELDRAITTFEARTSDLVAASGATLVKRLGDAVMFVTPSVAVACRLSLDLVDAFRDDGQVPEVKVGLAAGPVMALRGDYYGPPVNTASRVVDEAEASTVLVTSEVRRRVMTVNADVPFSPGPVRELPGINGPVLLWELRPGRPRRRRRRR